MDLNKEFLSSVKYLRQSHIFTLVYLYNWILSKNCPKFRYFDDGLPYFYIYLSKLAGDLFLCRRQIQNILFRLENKDKKVSTALQPFIFARQDKRENRLYIALNPAMIPFVVKDGKIIARLEKKLAVKTHNQSKAGGDKMPALFEVDNRQKKGYTSGAEALVCKILAENGDTFTTRVPAPGSQATKTFLKACRLVQDLWNGSFATCRENPDNDKLGDSKWFDTAGWREKIKSVKGDWKKVGSLLDTAVANYKLMFRPENMPFKKESLPRSFEKWLYDSFTFGFDKPVSYFVLSLKKPKLTREQLSENKADRIYAQLPGKAKKGGNELFEMNVEMPAGVFWENIEKMVKWGDAVCKVDSNARYWISSGSELPLKFADFCRKREIHVSPNTVDIGRSVECYAPWVWFVKDACKEHRINSRVVQCGTVEELFKLKKNSVSGVVF